MTKLTDKINIKDAEINKFTGKEYSFDDDSNITVKELIEALQKLDQNKKIAIHQTEWRAYAINIINHKDIYELFPWDLPKDQ
nr:MAG TPA: hypothetical protein [Caudoviricetes sp.]